MASLQRMQDVALSHRADLESYSNGVVARILASLDRLHQAIAARLSRTGSRALGPADQSILLTDVTAISQMGWERMRLLLGKELEALARSETEFALRLAELALGADARSMPLSPPDPGILRERIDKQAMFGRTPAAWMAEAEARDLGPVRDVINDGILNGFTGADLAQLLLGTRAGRHMDGVLEVTRRGLGTTVRTLITHVANVAAQVTWAANEPRIDGWRFLAIVDNRTTCLCWRLHGKTFPLGFGPWPPVHFRCRCVAVPYVGPPEEIDFDPTSFARWLREQAPELQDELLGPRFSALFRAGRLQLRNYLGDRGMALSLAALGERGRRAFIDDTSRTRR